MVEFMDGQKDEHIAKTYNSRTVAGRGGRTDGHPTDARMVGGRAEGWGAGYLLAIDGWLGAYGWMAVRLTVYVWLRPQV